LIVRAAFIGILLFIGAVLAACIFVGLAQR
jgi:hypothetical protein